MTRPARPGEFGEGYEIVYETKKAHFSKAISKTFGAMFCRGKKVVQNPSVMGGGVIGTTDTDYFYLLCPGCRGILQWNIRIFAQGPTDYPGLKKGKAEHLEFETWCRKCKMGGAVKMNNDCWQGGTLAGDVEREDISALLDGSEKK